MVICVKKTMSFGSLASSAISAVSLGAGFEKGGEFFRIILLAGEAEISQRDGVEVIVSEGDEAKSESTEINNFVDDFFEGALPRLLAIGAPDRAKGAVLWAATDGLHGGPHVFIGLHKIPAGGKEVFALNLAAVIDATGAADAGDRAAPGPTRRHRRL